MHPGPVCTLKTDQLQSAGQDVLRSKPLIYVLSSNGLTTRCHHCLSEPEDASKLMRCSRCKFACYCSAQCQKKAWEAWHQRECPAIQSIAPAKPTETVLLMARLFWRRKREESSKGNKSSMMPLNSFGTTIESLFDDAQFLTSSSSSPKDPCPSWDR